ncbi:hypothetical protein [Roseovarius aestuariivivens]|uniref:hypothetical protein n=1 Tax=Roseovarius aestuariivivens TaxID=1888910 RepID=UPI0010821F5F|nr:hypothetical protein [Roseovarius aestuariivivens]
MIRLAVILCLALAGAVAAQDGAQDGARDINAAILAAEEEAREDATPKLPAQPDIAGNLASLTAFYETATEAQKAAFLDTYTKLFTEAYANALRAQFTYRKQGFEHRSEVFAWQLTSSRIIFWTVIGLVIAGLVFSWMQFRLGLEQARATGQPLDMNTDLSGSEKGVSISSNVVGLVILVLSMGFFYLYLVYIYPISETF